MADIIRIGPDALDNEDWAKSDISLASWDVVVYWYQRPGYEGTGLALCLRSNGDAGLCDLSHCSCYGPGEVLNANKLMTTEEAWNEIHSGDPFPHQPRDYDWPMWKALREWSLANTNLFGR